MRNHVAQRSVNAAVSPLELGQPFAREHTVGQETSAAEMWRQNRRSTCFWVLIAFWSLWTASPSFGRPRDKLRDRAEMEVLNGKAEIVSYRGQRAVHLIPSPDLQGPEDSVLAILGNSEFSDGVIEVEVAGSPRSGAPADSRGFIGISFHVQPHGSRSETIYLRPTNARADDQLRRNHSVQYTSEPDFPWYRLREQKPGVYESYADLEPGAWTKMRIVVSGKEAQLYINGSPQPCLIVKDLKLGSSGGHIALWAHSSTDGYFSRLRITSAKQR